MFEPYRTMARPNLCSTSVKPADQNPRQKAQFMKRIFLAGLLGGIAMFIWTSIAHMALPLGEAGIREIPNEAAVLSAMQSNIAEKPDSIFSRIWAWPESESGSAT